MLWGDLRSADYLPRSDRTQLLCGTMWEDSETCCTFCGGDSAQFFHTSHRFWLERSSNSPTSLVYHASQGVCRLEYGSGTFPTSITSTPILSSVNDELSYRGVGDDSEKTGPAIICLVFVENVH